MGSCQYFIKQYYQKIHKLYTSTAKYVDIVKHKTWLQGLMGWNLRFSTRI